MPLNHRFDPAKVRVPAAVHSLFALKRGEEYIYHSGHLAFDRQFDRDLNTTAAEALRLAAMGHLTLLQRKLPGKDVAGVGPGYDYFARGRKG